MSDRTAETSRASSARIAGFTILFYMVVGFISVSLYGNATNAEGTTAIVARVAEHMASVQWTVVLELLECFSAVLLGVTLYAVTRRESQELAMLGMVLRVGEGVLGAIGIRTTLGLLWVAKGGGAMAPTSDVLGSFLLMPGQSAMVGAPFFAAGSLVFCYLFLRGRMIPAPLAWLGVLASVLLVVGVPLQLAGFLGGWLTPYLWMPMVIFQLPLGLWLLFKGVPSTTGFRTSREAQ